MKLEFSWQIFKKYSNIKFHETLSSGSRVVPCGRTDRRQTDMTNLIVVACNFSNARKTQRKSHVNRCKVLFRSQKGSSYLKTQYLLLISEVFAAENIEKEVFWDVTAYNLLGDYQHFRWICCLQVRGNHIGNLGSKVGRNFGIRLPHYAALHHTNCRINIFQYSIIFHVHLWMFMYSFLL
jgi:hypothetical protein